MDNRALSLAKKILNPDSRERLTTDKIISQPWMQTVFDDEGLPQLFSSLCRWLGLVLLLWQFSDVIVFATHKAKLPKH